MSIISQVHVIDVGQVELNDLILSTSYRDLVETQNAVFQASHAVLLSFVEASVAGWSVKAGSPIAVMATRIPEGIDQIRITSRGKNVELIFTDLTAPAVMATHSHAGAENTIISYYSPPTTGSIDILVGVNLDGFVRQMLIEWDSTKLP